MSNRIKIAVMLAVCAFAVCGCDRREPITMNLEEVRLNRYADAVVQTMNEYQVIRTRRYLYPGLGSWLDANRTAGIYKTEPEKINIFTEGENGGYQWQEVYYPYGFYDAEPVLGRNENNGQLLIAPMLLAADAKAVAYQTMGERGYALAVLESGKKTVFLDENGHVTDNSTQISDDPYLWKQFEYAWSADGTVLLYYKMAEPVSETSRKEGAEETAGENAEGGMKTSLREALASEDHMLSLPYGVYSYDRASGLVHQVWNPLEIEMPKAVYRSPAAGTVVADTREGLTAMFLLFNDVSGCPDVLLWGGESTPQIQLLNLPENPCIQLVLEEEAYYYQEDGKIQRARLGVAGQPELVVYTDPGLQSFLVSSDGQKVFTVEQRGDTEDICLYICDEKKNWYKQILYVGASGTRSIQLSEDELKLLVEGQVESASQLRGQSQVLILEFYHEEGLD